MERGVVTPGSREAEILRMIAALPPSLLGVRGAACALSVSRRTLGRVMVEAGLPSPRKWVVLARALRAHRILMNGGTVAAAAVAAGYDGPFTLSNALHRTTGFRPIALRTVGWRHLVDAWIARQRHSGALVTPADRPNMQPNSHASHRRIFMAGIRFITDLNAEVYVSVKGENPRSLQRAVLDTLRACGELGWRSGNVPPGGYRFPLANEADFDWRLIGARRGMCKIDDEEREGVWHTGLFYSRRELREQERKRLKRAVKYSRGARSTDRPEIVEDGGGDFRYVTLAVFRGDARRRAEYALPPAAARVAA